MKDIEKLKMLLNMLEESGCNIGVKVVDGETMKDVDIKELKEKLNGLRMEENDKTNDRIIKSIVVHEMESNDNNPVKAYRSFLETVKKAYRMTCLVNDCDDNKDLRMTAYNICVIQKCNEFLTHLFNHKKCTLKDEEELIDMFFNLRKDIEI